VHAFVLSNLESVAGFVPELVLIGAVCLLLLLGLGEKGGGKGLYGGLAVVALLFSVVAVVWLMTEPAAAPYGPQFAGMVVLDRFSLFFKLLVAVATAVAILLSWRSDEVPSRGAPEFMALLLGTTVGMYTLASSHDVVMLYLSLELVSLTSYVLAGYRRGDRQSSEAALKYVIYGGVASGAMIYGLSLLYGIAGSTSLVDIREALVAAPAGMSAAALLGITFSLAGFGYKIASVPFHMWCPDVYQGAPTPVTAFFSVAPKAAGFAALARFFFVAFVDPAGWGSDQLAVAGAVPWPVLVGIVAAFTMTLGNVTAVSQANIKRMLAYSSIAHAGYMLMAFVAVSETALTGVCFYLVVYLVMNFGVWVTVLTVGSRIGYEIEAWRGLGTRAPAAAILMAVFLFSLTGLPPLAGFVGKFYLFYAVIANGEPWLVALGIVGVLNSVVSLFYYANVVKKMFIEQADEGAEPVELPSLYAGMQWAFGLLTLLLGVYWGPLYDFVKDSIKLVVS